MSDHSTLFSEILQAAAVQTALWGAAGGLTNSLVTRPTVKQALRHIALGALIASGLGTGAGALIGSWIGAGGAAVAIGTAGGAGSFLAGVFGAAIIEVALRRISQGAEVKDDAE